MVIGIVVLLVGLVLIGIILIDVGSPKTGRIGSCPPGSLPIEGGGCE